MSVSARRVLSVSLWSALLDSVVGADGGTTAAADARVGVDVVDIALGDSLHGADGQTCAAGDTLVGDYVSHGLVLYFLFRFCFLRTGTYPFVGAKLVRKSRLPKPKAEKNTQM